MPQQMLQGHLFSYKFNQTFCCCYFFYLSRQSLRCCLCMHCILRCSRYSSTNSGHTKLQQQQQRPPQREQQQLCVPFFPRSFKQLIICCFASTAASAAAATQQGPPGCTSLPWAPLRCQLSSISSSSSSSSRISSTSSSNTSNISSRGPCTAAAFTEQQKIAFFAAAPLLSPGLLQQQEE